MGPTFLERLLAPRAVLLGAVAGFISCCLVGYLGPRTNIYTGFTRFHTYTIPGTFFYPTAAQLRALGREEPEKILVVIGGSSIFHGAGQSAEELWTVRLQEELGNGYRVLNLAMPAGSTHELGAVTAEMLTKEHRKVIYVANVNSLGSNADPDGAVYRYIFWDAASKGMLQPNPERDARVAEAIAARRADPRTAVTFPEFLRQVECDRVCRFQDCWTLITYQELGTVWSAYLDRKFLKPRRSFPDDSAPAQPMASRYPPHQQELARNALRTCVTIGTTPIPAYTQIYKNQFAPPNRERTLLVAVPFSPHYVRQLPPQEQEVYYGFFPPFVQSLRQAGFASDMALMDATPEDFADLSHISGAGAVKLVRAVAPNVRALAEKLGYTK
jgi:hypothetical protein